MTHVVASLLHPHGWWILADVLLVGASVTVALIFADAVDP